MLSWPPVPAEPLSIGTMGTLVQRCTRLLGHMQVSQRAD